MNAPTWLATSILPFLTAACTSYSPNVHLVGLSKEEVLGRMGQPEQKIPKAEGGTLWVYPRGPQGHHTYFLSFDTARRLLAYEQVLSRENFLLISPGMTQPEVERRIGPSKVRESLARQRGEVHSYRYESPFCDWFQVEYNAQKVVRSTGFGVPLECRGGTWGLSTQ